MFKEQWMIQGIFKALHRIFMDFIILFLIYGETDTIMIEI